MSSDESPSKNVRTDDPYHAIAVHQPSAVAVGGALITLVEPHAGHDDDYNRWYEDDHFYAGAMAGPWTFAGRRFVAPRPLRENRLPAISPIASPLTAGSYISLYWITAGHLYDNRGWAMDAMYEELTPAGRGNLDRDHIYTSFHEFAFDHVFDPEPMKSIHALSHPYQGLVVEIVGALPGVGRGALLDWLRNTLVPSRPLEAGQCVAFIPTPEQPAVLDSVKTDHVDMATCVCLLWFLSAEPGDGWPGAFAEHEALLAQSGLGELLLAAPFIPTVPGTRRYVDELR
ncbi:MAG: hypothetical protein JWO98_2161 [Frankiales bacterium]|nr:hypothetical protein [Frankiales bacterium]